jgi:hypothetical protein
MSNKTKNGKKRYYGNTHGVKKFSPIEKPAK